MRGTMASGFLRIAALGSPAVWGPPRRYISPITPDIPLQARKWYHVARSSTPCRQEFLTLRVETLLKYVLIFVDYVTGM